MRRTTILNAKEVKRTTFKEAEEAFFKHCKLKNLRPRSLEYYREDLHYFHTQVPVKYVDEIGQDVFENFIVNELERGKRRASKVSMGLLHGDELAARVEKYLKATVKISDERMYQVAGVYDEKNDK